MNDNKSHSTFTGPLSNFASFIDSGVTMIWLEKVQL